MTIVEFSDFECPYCRRLADSLKEAQKREPELFRYYFKHYPMDNACNRDLENEMHKNACTAATAMVCAQSSDKGWALHDKMFANQMDLNPKTIRSYAQEVGVDLERFNACMSGSKALETVKKDIEDGLKAKIDGTPTWFLNGIRMVGYRSPEEIIGLAYKELDAQKRGKKSTKNTAKPETKVKPASKSTTSDKTPTQ